MNKKSVRSPLFLFSGLLASLSLSLNDYSLHAQEKPAALTVIALTDFHGSLEAETVQSGDGQSVSAGGAALLASTLEVIRKSAPGPVLLLDGGDLFQGSMASNLAEGEPVIDFYRSIGVDAVAIGNHEFDFGPVGPHAVVRDGHEDPQGALKARIKQAAPSFPFLSANIVDDKGKTPEWLRKSIVKDVGGWRVGIVGASTEETPRSTISVNLAGLHVLPALEAIQTEALRLRQEEKVDVVLLTIHAGAQCKDNSDPNDLSSCENGELIKLLSALPEGLVDVAVGGHTHQWVAKKLKHTVILQSQSHAKRVSWTQVHWGTSVDSRNPIIGSAEICSAGIPRPQSVGGAILNGNVSCDPAALKKYSGKLQSASLFEMPILPQKQTQLLLAPALERVQVLKARTLGISTTDVFPAHLRQESALGNLIADALRAETPGAQIAVINGGGLRADFGPGTPLTYNHAFRTLPFDNQAALIQLSGAQLQTLVETGFRGKGTRFSWSGLTFKTDGCEISEIIVGDAPLHLEKKYSLAASDFLAMGGGGFAEAALRPEQIEIFWDPEWIQRDLFVKWLNGRAEMFTLKAIDYFGPENRRQISTGNCATQIR